MIRNWEDVYMEAAEGKKALEYLEIIRDIIATLKLDSERVSAIRVLLGIGIETDTEAAE